MAREVMLGPSQLKDLPSVEPLGLRQREDFCADS